MIKRRRNFFRAEIFYFEGEEKSYRCSQKTKYPRELRNLVDSVRQ